jgi:hypothetical protein
MNSWLALGLDLLDMNDLLLIQSPDQLQSLGLANAIDPQSFSALTPDAYLVLVQNQGSQCLALTAFLLRFSPNSRDVLQQRYTQTIDTVILKTVAVLPGRACAGLGNLLVAKVQAIAAQLGYTRAIHALIHDGNPSRNLSSRYAVPIRRYTLFSKQS